MADGWAAIVVNYNAGAALAGCVASVLAEDPRPEVVVVDNASTDGSVGGLLRAHPGVRVVHSGGNLGYARAANLGIAATSAPVVAVLNPDTVLTAGTGDALTARFAAEPDLGAVGPRLHNADGSVYPFSTATSFGDVYESTTSGGVASLAFTSTIPGPSSVFAVASPGPEAVFSLQLHGQWLPGPPAGVDVVTTAPTTTVGDPVKAEVSVFDEFGNDVADGTGVVLDASGTGGETPRSAGAAAAGGVASFTLTSTRPGTSTLTARAGAVEGSAQEVWSPRPGYWFVAADGGIFSFAAPFYGSGLVRSRVVASKSS